MFPSADRAETLQEFYFIGTDFGTRVCDIKFSKSENKDHPTVTISFDIKFIENCGKLRRSWFPFFSNFIFCGSRRGMADNIFNFGFHWSCEQFVLHGFGFSGHQGQSRWKYFDLPILEAVEMKFHFRGNCGIEHQCQIVLGIQPELDKVRILL